MSQLSGLGKYNIIGFVSIVDVSRARDFYRDTLGLRLVMEDNVVDLHHRNPVSLIGTDVVEFADAAVSKL